MTTPETLQTSPESSSKYGFHISCEVIHSITSIKEYNLRPARFHWHVVDILLKNLNVFDGYFDTDFEKQNS